MKLSSTALILAVTCIQDLPKPAAGFPGADIEARMAMDYFAPVVANTDPSNSVVVDMSCGQRVCR